MLNRKDAGATGLTALAVLVFAASANGSDVWLVGSSHRWAAAAILLLGAAGCAFGQVDLARDRDVTTTVLSALGVVAAVAGFLAVVTGSLTMLSVLVVCVVALWVGATARHVSHGAMRPAGKS